MVIGLLMILPGLSKAQVSNTSSPYSFSGVGQLNYQGFAAQRAAGYIGRTTRDKGTFSFTNPASYSALEFADMEFSASYNSVVQSSELQNRTYTNGTFDYIALGLPVIEGKLGLTIGLVPYSNAGYLLSEDVVEDSNNIEYIYEGAGAINRIYVGAGMEVLKGLSVGVNVGYDFGNIRRSKDKRYENTSDIFSFQDINETKYRGVGIDGGVQYSVQGNGGLTTVFGASASFGRNLNAENHQIFRTYNSLGNFIVDTLIDITYAKQALKIPLGYGLALQTGKSEKWGFGFEYAAQEWSTFEDISGIIGFNDMSSYSAGGFFQWLSPTIDRATLGKLEGFVKTLRISAGVRYEKGYMQFNDQEIEEFGISFGLGIPMLKKITLASGKVPVVSMLNLTAEWIQRGTTDNELIQEDLIRISVGLNFNDKWFIKRKFQ